MLCIGRHCCRDAASVRIDAEMLRDSADFAARMTSVKVLQTRHCKYHYYDSLPTMYRPHIGIRNGNTHGNTHDNTRMAIRMVIHAWQYARQHTHDNTRMTIHA